MNILIDLIGLVAGIAILGLFIFGPLALIVYLLHTTYKAIFKALE